MVGIIAALVSKKNNVYINHSAVTESLKLVMMKVSMYVFIHIEKLKSNSIKLMT